MAWWHLYLSILVPRALAGQSVVASRIKRTLSTTSGQGAVLFGMSDILGQSLSKQPIDPEVRVRRTTAAVLYGYVWVGSVQARWYKFIDRVAPPKAFGLLTKVAATWVVLGIGSNSVNMFYQQLIETKGAVRESLSYTRHHVLEVILNDARVWPIFDLLVFSVVPPPIRPFSVVCMSLAWNTYVSLASHQTTPH